MTRVSNPSATLTCFCSLPVKVLSHFQCTVKNKDLHKTCYRILQCRRRPFGPLSLQRQQFHPGPIPITRHIYPASPPDTRGNSAWPIHLTRISLDCGRKPEHPEETLADTGRMCKLHTDSDPSRELNPGPWRYEAAMLTTVPPCRHVFHFAYLHRC